MQSKSSSIIRLTKRAHIFDPQENLGKMIHKCYRLAISLFDNNYISLGTW